MADNSKDPFHDPEDKSARFAHDKAALEGQAAAETKPAPHEGHIKADAPVAALEQSANDQAAMSDKEQAAIAVANDPSATPEHKTVGHETNEAVALTSVDSSLDTAIAGQAETQAATSDLNNRTEAQSGSHGAAYEQALLRNDALIKRAQNVLLGAESVSPETGRHVAEVISNAVEAERHHVTALTTTNAVLIDENTGKALAEPEAQAAERLPHNSALENTPAEKGGFAAKIAPRETHVSAEIARAEQTSVAERGVA